MEQKESQRIPIYTKCSLPLTHGVASRPMIEDEAMKEGRLQSAPAVRRIGGSDNSKWSGRTESMGLKSNSATSPSSQTTEKQKVKLRHCFRFSLRTWLAVFLIAALAGLATHSVIRLGGEMVEETQRRSSIRNAQYFSDYSEGYAENVRSWYEAVAGDPLVARDALDRVMRRAKKLPESDAAGLERLSKARREGDTTLVYAVWSTPIPIKGAPVGANHEYAFLVRDDWIVFFAERAPSDMNWVETSVGFSKYATDYEEYLNGMAVFGSMLLVFIAAAGLLLLVGLFRYLRAQWNELTTVKPRPRRVVPSR